MKRKPKHQIIIVGIAYVLGGLMALGMIFDSLANAISLMTLPTSLGLTFVFLITYLSIKAYLNHKPLAWVVNGTELRLKKLGIKPTLYTLGAIILLWLPHLKYCFHNQEIFGEWNDRKALNVMFEILEKNNSTFGCADDRCFHALIDFYNIQMKDNEMIVGVTWSSNEWDICRVCGTNLSFFEFVRSDNGWILEKARISQISAGSWGGPPDNIEVYLIGNNRYGFTIEQNWMSQGYRYGHVDLYTYLSDDLKEVFSFFNYENDSWTKEDGIPKDSFVTKINIHKVGSGFYDFIKSTSGIKNGEPIKYDTLYKFNGIKYVKSENYY